MNLFHHAFVSRDTLPRHFQVTVAPCYLETADLIVLPSFDLRKAEPVYTRLKTDSNGSEYTIHIHWKAANV